MKEKVSFIGLLANLFLFVFKLVAGIISGSYAVLADAVNSGSDIFASAINFFGIKIANKPADKEHPYGHERYEVLAGFFITLIIFLSALYIIYRAILGIFKPEEILVNYFAIGVMVVSFITNEVMARLKIYYGKKENSLALLSDGTHSRIDVLTSLGVLIGLIFSKYWIYADPIIALIIGIWILKEAWRLGKETSDNLLDVSVGEEKEDAIKNIIEKEDVKVSEIKTRKRGASFSANIIVKIPKNLKVEEALYITKKLEKELIKKIDDLNYVVISIEGENSGAGFYRGKLKNHDWYFGIGPEGNCICEKCGYKVKHMRGVPCSSIKCPKCKIPLVRENAKA